MGMQASFKASRIRAPPHQALLALTDVLDLVGDLLALDDEGDLGTVRGKSHRVRLLKVFVNYFSYNQGDPTA